MPLQLRGPQKIDIKLFISIDKILLMYNIFKIKKAFSVARVAGFHLRLVKKLKLRLILETVAIIY